MAIQRVKGTHDIYGDDSYKYRYVSDLFKAVGELYGYGEMTTPVLEYTEVFQRGTGESSDIVRKEMYTFDDKGHRSVTMRPEFTAGVMRAFIANKLYGNNDVPYKYYYYGPAFRYERPQLGRFREFHQFGIEALGLDSSYLDAEVVLLAAQAFAMLGFENISIKINTLGDEESRNNYRNALKEFFTQHIDHMCPDCKERLDLNPLRILDCKVPEDHEIAMEAPKMKDYLSEASEKRFYETLSILNEYGIDYEIDDSLVRGLDYYSEMVFEIHLLSSDGKDYGALCGGGHYGQLVKELGGPDMAGVGFAAGVERIVSLMDDEHLFDGLETGVDLYIMPCSENEVLKALEIAQYTRAFGYSTDTPLAKVKMGTQFKKALRKNAKVALIVGESEVENSTVQVKNLLTEEQKEVAMEELIPTLDQIFGEGSHHHHH